MSAPDVRDLLDADGPAAPPRRNGELVFQAPWESRLFGVTLSLHRAGVFEWDEFRRLLIEAIADWESQGHDESTWSYYERWHAALEKLLATRQLCGADELSARARALARRPAGHDHH